MRFTKILVLGNGGHAQVLVQLIKEQPNLEFVGFVADKNNESQDAIFCSDSELSAINPQEFSLALGVGSNIVRKQLFEDFKSLGFNFVTLISKNCYVAPMVSMGEGTIVMPGVVVNTHAVIGRGVILNTACSIDHHSSLGDFSHLAPKSTLCGTVSIGEGSLIGAGAVCVPNINIDSWCTVGAGSVVLRDLAKDSRVAGSPARPI